MDLKTKRAVCLVIGVAFIIAIVSSISYAYFSSMSEVQSVESVINTATVSARFSDNGTEVGGKLNFGESITKKFIIENTGTAEAHVKMYWVDLINTYMSESLTYTLSYSENEAGPFTEVVEKTSVPASTNPKREILASGLDIPVGKTYYYNLVITLNYLDDVNQDTDLEAKFYSKFGLEDINYKEKYIITFNANGGATEIATKSVTADSTYGKLPIPVYDGYSFSGWYTSPTGGVKIEETTTVNLSEGQTLYARWIKLCVPNATTTLANGLKVYGSSVTEYTDCNNEMYTFSHDATDQTPALTDYRYIGKNPNNYVTFNDEVWRIIGVFQTDNGSGTYEQRIKLIRNESIGNLAWNSSIYGWWDGSLQLLLNSGDYYKRMGSYASIGLNTKAKSQIGSAKWYLGGVLYYQATEKGYKDERGASGYFSDVEGKGINIVQSVGLMYPSDFLYTCAYGVNSGCFNGDTSDYLKKGWLTNEINEWTITNRLNNGSQVFVKTSYGSISSGSNDYLASKEYAVRPVVYLKSGISVVSGNGSQSNPYQLG